MSVEKTYRDKALTARREAREKLLEFRESRLKTRRRVAPGQPESSAEPAEAASRKSDSTISPGAFFAIGTPDTAETPATDPTAPVAEVEAAKAIEAVEADAPRSEDTTDDVAGAAGDDDMPSEDARPEEQIALLTDDADQDAGNDVVSAGTDDPDADTMPSSPVQETGFEIVDSASDLFELPGAGAGMVWMFHQCGVNSLSDLAREDTESLSQRLGVVGHILNVEPWIDFARQRVDAAA